MKMFYRNALLKDGFDENSEKYRDMERFFDRQKKIMKRDRRRRKRAGITFVPMSQLVDLKGNPLDFASDEAAEENILHEIELEDLRDCLNELPVEDKELLLRVYDGKYGEMAKIARELGVSYNDLNYRVKKLIKKLREMMREKGSIFLTVPLIIFRMI